MKTSDVSIQVIFASHLGNTNAGPFVTNTAGHLRKPVSFYRKRARFDKKLNHRKDDEEERA